MKSLVIVAGLLLHVLEMNSLKIVNLLLSCVLFLPVQFSIKQTCDIKHFGRKTKNKIIHMNTLESGMHFKRRGSRTQRWKFTIGDRRPTWRRLEKEAEEEGEEKKGAVHLELQALFGPVQLWETSKMQRASNSERGKDTTSEANAGGRGPAVKEEARAAQRKPGSGN